MQMKLKRVQNISSHCLKIKTKIKTKDKKKEKGFGKVLFILFTFGVFVYSDFIFDSKIKLVRCIYQ
jgi:hypothetical protein